MNSRLHDLLRPAGVLAVCLALASCGDDPEMVLKREQQRTEISKLESELSILQEKMDQLPPDRSTEVAQLKVDAEANRSQITALESEIETLERQKSQIEKDHAAYRQKYVVR